MLSKKHRKMIKDFTCLKIRVKAIDIASIMSLEDSED